MLAQTVAPPENTGTVHGMAHNSTPQPAKLLGYPELSEILGVAVSTLKHWKVVGNFPATCNPPGTRRVLVHPDDLELWLAQQRRTAA